MSREELEFMRKVEEKSFTMSCDDIEVEFSQRYMEMESLVVENYNLDKDLNEIKQRISKHIETGEDLLKLDKLYSKLKRAQQLNDNIIMDKIDSLSILNVALKNKGCKLPKF